jgi:hypothetical protein
LFLEYRDQFAGRLAVNAFSALAAQPLLEHLAVSVVRPVDALLQEELQGIL